MNRTANARWTRRRGRRRECRMTFLDSALVIYWARKTARYALVLLVAILFATYLLQLDGSFLILKWRHSELGAGAGNLTFLYLPDEPPSFLKLDVVRPAAPSPNTIVGVIFPRIEPAFSSQMLLVPLWLAVVVAGGACICLFRLTRTNAPSESSCSNCSYQLRGNLSGICPECGSPVPEAQMRKIANARGGQTWR